MSDASQPGGLSAEARTEQRNQATTELVKALLIINGGGAAVLYERLTYHPRKGKR
jgi:hypothetical protein